jgi:hypothetical protein
VKGGKLKEQKWRASGHTLAHHASNTIPKALQIYALEERIEDYENNWHNQISRMNVSRLMKKEKNYQPNGRRDAGRPRRRWGNSQ